MNAQEPKLRAGLTELGLALTDAQVTALLVYMELIQKWNRVYNLTAVRDVQEMLTHHVLDSLAVVRPLQQQLRALGHGVSIEDGVPGTTAPVGEGASAINLLDVGSGAGLPGVVLAVACPWLQVDCVDTVAKKAAFIQQVAASLKLPNLHGVHARVEALRGPYTVISSRAFASLVDFVSWSAQALAPHGIWMAMKGKQPQDEITLLPKAVNVFHVEPLQVPGLSAQRCVVWMRRGG